MSFSNDPNVQAAATDFFTRYAKVTDYQKKLLSDKKIFYSVIAICFLLVVQTIYTTISWNKSLKIEDMLIIEGRCLGEEEEGIDFGDLYKIVKALFPLKV